MAFANNPKLVNSPSGVVGELSHTNVGTGTSAFLEGELVYMNAGVVTTVSASAAGALSSTVIWGQALQDDGASATEVQCQVILPTQIWKIKLTASGTANTAATFTKGVAYGLYHGTNEWYADSDGTAQDMIVYMGPAPSGTESLTTATWGLFRFVPTYCQAWIGA